MTRADVERIESELGVSLPEPYKAAVLTYPFTEDRGTINWSLGDLASAVIEQTRLYRAGFSVNPPWPHRLVWIGTDGDGCPNVIDVESGAVSKLYKGNPVSRPMEYYATFEEFLEDLRVARAEVS